MLFQCWASVEVISTLANIETALGECLLFAGNLCPDPLSTRRSLKFDSMLGQRRRRWTNIESNLGESHVFAGEVYANLSSML